MPDRRLVGKRILGYSEVFYLAIVYTICWFLGKQKSAHPRAFDPQGWCIATTVWTEKAGD
jgi:hypothetical protein